MIDLGLGYWRKEKSLLCGSHDISGSGRLLVLGLAGGFFIAQIASDAGFNHAQPRIVVHTDDDFVFLLAYGDNCAKDAANRLDFVVFLEAGNHGLLLLLLATARPDHEKIQDYRDEKERPVLERIRSLLTLGSALGGSINIVAYNMQGLSRGQ
jgi:hypothetical protein